MNKAKKKLTIKTLETGNDEGHNTFKQELHGINERIEALAKKRVAPKFFDNVNVPDGEPGKLVIDFLSCIQGSPLPNSHIDVVTSTPHYTKHNGGVLFNFNNSFVLSPIDRQKHKTCSDEEKQAVISNVARYKTKAPKKSDLEKSEVRKSSMKTKNKSAISDENVNTSNSRKAGKKPPSNNKSAVIKERNETVEKGESRISNKVQTRASLREHLLRSMIDDGATEANIENLTSHAVANKSSAGDRKDEKRRKLKDVEGADKVSLSLKKPKEPNSKLLQGKQRRNKRQKSKKVTNISSPAPEKNLSQIEVILPDESNKTLSSSTDQSRSPLKDKGTSLEKQSSFNEVISVQSSIEQVASLEITKTDEAISNSQHVNNVTRRRKNNPKSDAPSVPNTSIGVGEHVSKRHVLNEEQKQNNQDNYARDTEITSKDTQTTDSQGVVASNFEKDHQSPSASKSEPSGLEVLLKEIRDKILNKSETLGHQNIRRETPNADPHFKLDDFMTRKVGKKDNSIRIMEFATGETQTTKRHNTSIGGTDKFSALTNRSRQKPMTSVMDREYTSNQQLLENCPEQNKRDHYAEAADIVHKVTQTTAPYEDATTSMDCPVQQKQNQQKSKKSVMVQTGDSRTQFCGQIRQKILPQETSTTEQDQMETETVSHRCAESFVTEEDTIRKKRGWDEVLQICTEMANSVANDSSSEAQSTCGSSISYSTSNNRRFPKILNRSEVEYTKLHKKRKCVDSSRNKQLHYSKGSTKSEALLHAIEQIVARKKHATKTSQASAAQLDGSATSAPLFKRGSINQMKRKILESDNSTSNSSDGGYCPNIFDSLHPGNSLDFVMEDYSNIYSISNKDPPWRYSGIHSQIELAEQLGLNFIPPESESNVTQVNSNHSDYDSDISPEKTLAQENTDRLSTATILRTYENRTKKFVNTTKRIIPPCPDNDIQKQSNKAVAASNDQIFDPVTSNLTCLEPSIELTNTEGFQRDCGPNAESFVAEKDTIRKKQGWDEVLQICKETSKRVANDSSSEAQSTCGSSISYNSSNSRRHPKSVKPLEVEYSKLPKKSKRVENSTNKRMRCTKGSTKTKAFLHTMEQIVARKKRTTRTSRASAAQLDGSGASAPLFKRGSINQMKRKMYDMIRLESENSTSNSSDGGDCRNIFDSLHPGNSLDFVLEDYSNIYSISNKDPPWRYSGIHSQIELPEQLGLNSIPPESESNVMQVNSNHSDYDSDISPEKTLAQDNTYKLPAATILHTYGNRTKNFVKTTSKERKVISPSKKRIPSLDRQEKPTRASVAQEQSDADEVNVSNPTEEDVNNDGAYSPKTMNKPLPSKPVQNRTIQTPNKPKLNKSLRVNQNKLSSKSSRSSKSKKEITRNRMQSDDSEVSIMEKSTSPGLVHKRIIPPCPDNDIHKQSNKAVEASNYQISDPVTSNLTCFEPSIELTNTDGFQTDCGPNGTEVQNRTQPKGSKRSRRTWSICTDLDTQNILPERTRRTRKPVLQMPTEILQEYTIVGENINLSYKRVSKSVSFQRKSKNPRSSVKPGSIRINDRASGVQELDDIREVSSLEDNQEASKDDRLTESDLMPPPKTMEVLRAPGRCNSDSGFQSLNAKGSVNKRVTSKNRKNRSARSNTESQSDEFVVQPNNDNNEESSRLTQDQGASYSQNMSSRTVETTDCTGKQSEFEGDQRFNAEDTDLNFIYTSSSMLSFKPLADGCLINPQSTPGDGYTKAGCMKILPHKSKPTSRSDVNTILYTVDSGFGYVKIAKKRRKIGYRTKFKIFKGQPYLIKNTSTTEPLLLQYVQFNSDSV